MPLKNLPTYKTIVNRIRADVTRLLDKLDPTVWVSLIKTITDSNAGRHYDNVLSIKQLEKELFPTKNASLESLEIWGGYEGIKPLPATQAIGLATFIGIVGSLIEEGTEYKSSLDNIYGVDADAIIATVVESVTLTRVGTTVTAETPSDHHFASNMDVIMAGADLSDYNGEFPITVIAANKFTYEITTAPTTPATGTITATADIAEVSIVSDGFGAEQNLDSGGQLTAIDQVSGVENIGLVQFGQIAGGTDLETPANYLTRIIQKRENPVANFNVAAIDTAARSINGVTRVKVKRITPAVGSVTILFVKDANVSIIPNASEIAEVKAAIVELLQVTSEEDDVVVPTITPVENDYIFSSIVPNTATMKAAVIENIKAFYQDIVTFEQDVLEIKYNSAIDDTIDPDTGDKLESFTLSAPSGDITVGTDSIGTFGEAIF